MDRVAVLGTRARNGQNCDGTALGTGEHLSGARVGKQKDAPIPQSGVDRWRLKLKNREVATGACYLETCRCVVGSEWSPLRGGEGKEGGPLLFTTGLVETKRWD